MPRPAALEGSGDLLNTKSSQRLSSGNAVMTSSCLGPTFTMVTRRMAKEAKLREMKVKRKAWREREKNRERKALPPGLRLQREHLFKEMNIEEIRLHGKSSEDLTTSMRRDASEKKVYVRELRDFRLDFSGLKATRLHVSRMGSMLTRNRTWPAKGPRSVKNQNLKMGNGSRVPLAEIC